ncbi:hypothetical protein QTP86_011434 [Hemibagrus guttatus]|nr:hypothetical protein QTP86_011434 [Hemibagrus guttatus]
MTRLHEKDGESHSEVDLLVFFFWIIVLLQNPSLLQLELTNLPIYQSGKGYKAISKALGLPRTTVRAIIYKWRKHGTVENLPRSGRPTKITPRAQRQLIQEVIKYPTTSKELQASLASVKLYQHPSVPATSTFTPHIMLLGCVRAILLHTNCVSANGPALIRSCWSVHVGFLFHNNDAHKRYKTERPLVENIQPVKAE